MWMHGPWGCPMGPRRAGPVLRRAGRRSAAAPRLQAARKASRSAPTNPEAASGPALLPPACVPSRWAASAPAEARALVPHTGGPPAPARSQGPVRSPHARGLLAHWLTGRCAPPGDGRGGAGAR